MNASADLKEVRVYYAENTKVGVRKFIWLCWFVTHKNIAHFKC
jgi:hypothetical protein